jgi:hypothetical protein
MESKNRAKTQEDLSLHITLEEIEEDGRRARADQGLGKQRN